MGIQDDSRQMGLVFDVMFPCLGLDWRQPGTGQLRCFKLWPSKPFATSPSWGSGTYDRPDDTEVLASATLVY